MEISANETAAFEKSAHEKVSSKHQFENQPKSQFCEVCCGTFVLSFGEAEINDNFDIRDSDRRFANNRRQNNFSSSTRWRSEQAFQFSIIFVSGQCRVYQEN